MSENKENPLKVVDVSSVDQVTADSILDGFASQGFLFVDGHDFTQEEVDHFFAISKEYFTQPHSEKIKYAIDVDDCGYTTFNQENLNHETQKKGDPKEAFNFGMFNFLTGDCKKEMLPPTFAPGTDNYEFIKKISLKLNALGTKILNLLALGLQIDEDQGGVNWFSDRHKPDAASMTSMRMLHYPSASKLDSDQTIRAGAHTDYGSLTLLFQKRGEEGLELFEPYKEQWKTVPYVESDVPEYKSQGKAAPIVVNIADQLSFWTNQVLKSTLHRVVLPTDGDRYSIVFFFDANDDTKLVPIPSKIVREADEKGLGKGIGLNEDGSYITARDYSLKRFKETYATGH